jgi:hypothetical protein
VASDIAPLVTIWPEQNATIISFPGTHDFRMAIGDAEMILRSGPDDTMPGGKLHSGVLKAVQKTLPALIEQCHSQPIGTNLYFTGHSFGGGCAPLTAYAFARAGFNVAGVMTFAGMRFADAQFAANYNALLGAKTVRVTARYDVVPHLPLPLPRPFSDYRHVGSEVYLYQPFLGGAALPRSPFIGADQQVSPTSNFVSLKIGRPAMAILEDNAQTIFKAWLTLKSGRLTLPLDIVLNHEISRYQNLLALRLAQNPATTS